MQQKKTWHGLSASSESLSQTRTRESDMHTTSLTGGVVAVHHGDMSGKIALAFMGKQDYSHRAWLLDDNGFRSSDPIQDNIEIELSFEDIRTLYLGHLRRQMISDLEKMTDEQLEEKLREY